MQMHYAGWTATLWEGVFRIHQGPIYNQFGCFKRQEMSVANWAIFKHFILNFSNYEEENI